MYLFFLLYLRTCTNISDRPFKVGGREKEFERLQRSENPVEPTAVCIRMVSVAVDALVHACDQSLGSETSRH